MEILVIDPDRSVGELVARGLRDVPGVERAQVTDIVDAVGRLAKQPPRVVVMRSQHGRVSLERAVKAVRQVGGGLHIVVYFAKADEVPWQTAAELDVDLILDLPRETAQLASFVMQYVSLRVQWVQPTTRRRD